MKALEELGENEIEVITLLRGRSRRYEPAGNVVIKAGDILILQGEPAALERIVALEKLKLTREGKSHEIDTPSDEIGVIEAVITPDSPLVGSSAGQLKLFDRYAVNLLAVSRTGPAHHPSLALGEARAGDVVVFRGNLAAMPETLGELHCLPLAERDLRIGRKASLGADPGAGRGHGAGGVQVVPVAIAFFGAALMLLLARSLSLREAYDAIEWPILIMLGALIPVSEAVRTTGGTELIAGWLSHAAGPAGHRCARADARRGHGGDAVPQQCRNRARHGADRGELRRQLGYSPDPFLMAVAVGAACDFLTPIGHQCNTLVMGPGGYRFGDYWRLGLPLSFIVIAIGTPLIAFFWPA